MSRDFPGSSVADLQRDSTLWFISRDFHGSSVVDLQRDSTLWFMSRNFPGSSVVDLQHDSSLWFMSRNFLTSKRMTTTRKEMMTAAMIPMTSAAMLRRVRLVLDLLELAEIESLLGRTENVRSSTLDVKTKLATKIHEDINAGVLSPQPPELQSIIWLRTHSNLIHGW
ncbi:hypothetical protein RRG08_066888 [Elysia crispata]|uniref:Uncharacterized protein n=1 Tax=Elysia crispata TaxID=231223 RepID=A0AAE1E626_9GAST|nr:hypothetical protein RRG08_066888 [Elysia crispata]